MNDLQQNVTMQTKLVVNPNMVLREEDDDFSILFDPDSGSVRILNQTATTIWKSLDGQRTVSDITKILVPQFDDVDADAEDQVLELLNELFQIGAVGTITELSKWSS